MDRIELDRIELDHFDPESTALAAGGQAEAFRKPPERGRKRREANRAQASPADFTQSELVMEESASNIARGDGEAEGDAVVEENADGNSEPSVHRVDDRI